MTVSLPSNRSFGLLFVVVFGALSAYWWWRGSHIAWLVWGGLSALFLLLTLIAPSVLQPLNRAWMAFAGLLNKIFSPLMLGAMFFLIFTPVALFMKLIRRDTMHRKFDKQAQSYWIVRDPPGPSPESLRDQF